MEEKYLGEVVWLMELRELQVNHLNNNELSLFYKTLEDALSEVLDNFEVSGEWN